MTRTTPTLDDEEWQAHLDLLFGDWKPRTLDKQLRYIVQYARAGQFYPADMHVAIIKQAVYAALVENLDEVPPEDELWRYNGEILGVYKANIDFRAVLSVVLGIGEDK